MKKKKIKSMKQQPEKDWKKISAYLQTMINRLEFSLKRQEKLNQQLNMNLKEQKRRSALLEKENQHFKTIIRDLENKGII